MTQAADNFAVTTTVQGHPGRARLDDKDHCQRTAQEKAPALVTSAGAVGFLMTTPVFSQTAGAGANFTVEGTPVADLPALIQAARDMAEVAGGALLTGVDIVPGFYPGIRGFGKERSGARPKLQGVRAEDGRVYSLVESPGSTEPVAIAEVIDRLFDPAMVDLDQAREYFAMLGGGGHFVINVLHTTPACAAEAMSTDSLAIRKGPMTDERLRELAELNSRGGNVFAVAQKSTGLGRDDVSEARILFVDVDEKDPVACHAIIDDALTCGVEPTMVVRTGNGAHIYWRIEDGAIAVEDITAWQKALIRRFKGDPSIHDRQRIMRVPGFLHVKDHSNPKPVTIIHRSEALRVDVADLAMVEGVEVLADDAARVAGNDAPVDETDLLTAARYWLTCIDANRNREGTLEEGGGYRSIVFAAADAGVPPDEIHAWAQGKHNYAEVDVEGMLSRDRGDGVSWRTLEHAAHLDAAKLGKVHKPMVDFEDDGFPAIEDQPESIGVEFEKMGAVTEKALARVAVKLLRDEMRIAGHKAKTTEGSAGRRLSWWNARSGLWEQDETGGMLDDRLHSFVDTATAYRSTRLDTDARGKPKANPMAVYSNYRPFTALRSMFLSVAEARAQRLPTDTSGSLWKLAMRGEDGHAVLLDITGKEINRRRTTKEDYSAVVTSRAVVPPPRVPTEETIVDVLREVAPTWAQVLEKMVGGAVDLRHHENYEREQIYAACAAMGLALMPSGGTDKIVTFTGASRSGKTAMLNALGALLGNNLLRSAGSGYMATDRAGAANDTVLAGALNAHILFVDEVTKLDAAKACTLTGATLGAADKNEKFAQVQSRLTLVLASNGFGPVGDDEQIRAFCNRVYPIMAHTSSAGEEDTSLPAKLVAEVSAAAGVFVTVLHHECWKTGVFAPALPVFAWTEELARKLVYKGAAMSQREWLVDCFDLTEADDGEAISAAELTREWRTLSNLRELPPSHREFVNHKDGMIRALRSVGYDVPASGHAKVKMMRRNGF